MPNESDHTDEIDYVPASPGFDVLTYLPDDKTFEAQPVVAWALLLGAEGFVAAQPVTIPPWSVNDDRTVQLPTGEVICGDHKWATAAEWLAEMKTNDGKPLDADARVPKSSGEVLALDAFRGKFQGQ